MPAAIGESRRRSGRLSSTSMKSKYFEDSETESDQDELPPKKRGRPPKRASLAKQDSEEQYKKEDDDSEEEDELAVDSDEEEPPRKKNKRGRPAKKAALVKKESEDYVEDGEGGDGDDDGEESEFDEDAPMKVTFEPHVQLRPVGGVEYADHKIHENSLLFLKDLKANNRRPWLKSHDEEYRRALKDWNTFAETATQTIVELDETVPELPIKDITFRIHRDVRFSKDPTPYKPHFSAAWSRTGRKGPYACYYIHLEPGSSFIGGGLWCPEASHIRKIRRSIDRHPDQWRDTLADPELKGVFFPEVKGGKDAREKAVKAFCGGNQRGALKKKPMGYEATHPEIELLKLRNFTIGKKIEDDFFCRDDTQQKLEPIVVGLRKLVYFLNRIVMPDPDDESESEEEEEAEEQDVAGA